MDNQEVIQIAKKVAKSEGWVWLEPVSISRYRRYFFGPVICKIVTNSESRGLNISIEIDDVTGKIINKYMLPR